MTNREKLAKLISDEKNVSSYKVVCELYSLGSIATQFNDSKHGLAAWLDEEYPNDNDEFMKEINAVETKIEKICKNCKFFKEHTEEIGICRIQNWNTNMVLNDHKACTFFDLKGDIYERES